MFAAAALPRLAYLVGARPPFTYEHYWEMATSLLQRHTLGFDGAATTMFEPVYPLFIAAVRMLGGDRALPVQLVQLAIASAGAIFLHRLTERLTASRRAALIAAGMYAIYPLLIRHASDDTDGALMAVLMLIFCLAFTSATTMAGAAWAGAWLGLAALTRAMALPLVALGAAVLAANRQLRAGAAFAAAALLVFAPYAIRNYSLNGSLVPTRSGLNLFVSNSVYTPQLLPAYHPDVLEAAADELLVQKGLSAGPSRPALERQRDRALTQHARHVIAEHPWMMGWQRIKNVGYFFSPTIVPLHRSADDVAVHLGRDGRVRLEHSPLQPRWVRVAYTASYTPVLALALAGVYRRRQSLRADAILWSVVVTFVTAHAIYFPATRYRVPMEFVLLYYAAVGLDAAAERLVDWSGISRCGD